MKVRVRLGNMKERQDKRKYMNSNYISSRKKKPKWFAVTV